MALRGRWYRPYRSGKQHKGPSAPGSRFHLPSPGAIPEPAECYLGHDPGADLVWSPISFAHSFQMAYTRTHYGTGYYIYDQFVPGTPLSRPIQSWNESIVPDQDVLDLIAKSGTDISPQGAKEVGGKVNVPASGAVTAVELKGKATIRLLSFSIPRDQAAAVKSVRLRVTWDGRPQPSIDAPIALFYGAGTLYNRDNREYLVKAFPSSIRFTQDRIHLACYFPMPFFRSARIQLVGGGQQIDGVEWQVRSVPLQQPAVAYFHATYRDFPAPAPGQDLVLLDTGNMEGAKQWSGRFVGTSFIFSHQANLQTLEGDPRFFFDDSLTPQAQGTGTEEWGGGGDYWGGLNMTLPFAGHPVGARSAQLALNEEDKIESAYRFLLADLMPFGKNAVIHLEHGGKNKSTEPTRRWRIGMACRRPRWWKPTGCRLAMRAAEHAHDYSSPQASRALYHLLPLRVGCRYVGWSGHLSRGAGHGPHDQGHLGVSSSSSPRQPGSAASPQAGLRVSRSAGRSVHRGQRQSRKGSWPASGIWPGRIPVVYSEPEQTNWEPRSTIVETSNRRFRDDEFLVSRELTQGQKSDLGAYQIHPGQPATLSRLSQSAIAPGVKSATPLTASSLPGAAGKRSSSRLDPGNQEQNEQECRGLPRLPNKSFVSRR